IKEPAEGQNDAGTPAKYREGVLGSIDSPKLRGKTPSSDDPFRPGVLSVSYKPSNIPASQAGTLSTGAKEENSIGVIDGPWQIVQGIYLGTGIHAASLNILKDLRINGIVNMTIELAYYWERPGQVPMILDDEATLGTINIDL